MTRLNRRNVAIGVAGAGAALAIAFAVPNLAFAQDPAATPTASPSASTPAAKPDRAAERAKRQDELATALAKELGIDKDKVAAALAKVEAARPGNRPSPEGTARPKPPAGTDLKTRLAAAVSAGRLTQAEADAIIKATEAGVLGPGGGRPHGR